MKLLLVEQLNQELDDYTERVLEVYRYAVSHAEPAKIVVLSDQQELGQLALQYDLPKVDVVSVFDVALGTTAYEHGPRNFADVPRPPLAEVASGFREGVLRDGALVYADLVYFTETDTRNRFVAAVKYRDSRGLQQDTDYYDYRGFKFLTEQVVDGQVVSRRFFKPSGKLGLDMLYLAGEISLIRWWDGDTMRLFTTVVDFIGTMLQRAQVMFDGGFAVIDRPEMAMQALAAGGLQLSEQLAVGGNAYHELFATSNANHDGQRIGIVLNGGVKLADYDGTVAFLAGLTQEKVIVNTGPAYGWVAEFAEQTGAQVVLQDRRRQTLAQLSAELFGPGDVVLVFQTNSHLDNVYRVNAVHDVLTIDLGTNIYNHDLLDEQMLFQEDLANTSKLLSLLTRAN